MKLTLVGIRPGDDKETRAGVAISYPVNDPDYSPQHWLMHLRSALRALERHETIKAGLFWEEGSCQTEVLPETSHD